MRLLIAIAATFSVVSICSGANFTSDDRSIVAKAEDAREQLAIYWLGSPFPTWATPCPIAVSSGPSSGATSFAFDRGEVFGWRMTVRGTSQAILEDVLPHEVNHTIFATRFRRPLPRWLDEGASAYVESEAEHYRQRLRLDQNRQAGIWIPFEELFRIDEYPRDGARLAMLYLEGFAIVSYLIDEYGPSRFVDFVEDVRADDGRSTVVALRAHYGTTPDELEKNWRRRWESRYGLRCKHHACKAPHSGVCVDPALILTDGVGSGVGIRSPVFGFTRPIPRIRSPSVGRPSCFVLIFSGSRCGPCIEQERSVFPSLIAAGWSVGPTGSDFEIRKDDSPGAKSLGVSSYPTAILIHNGKEIRRAVGFQTAKELQAMISECRPGPEPGPSPAPEPEPVDLGAELAELRSRLEALEKRPEPKPTEPVDLSPVRDALDYLDKRMTEIEKRPTPEPVDLSEIESRIGAIEGLRLPVRIETSEGVVVREREYRLTRAEDGSLRFAPLVLKFDEKILRGE